MPKTNKLTDESTGTSLLYTEKQHQFDSMTPCVRLRALPIDRIRRRCLSARRAASSFSDSRIQRTTAVDPDIDERDISDPTDVASDADDSERRNTERGRPGPCPCPRRRREPYSRFVDVLRETLVPVRGTWGNSGRCGRTGGMRDARGSGKERRLDGVGGRALLPLPREEECKDDVVTGSSTPRMCTMPAPSRVSSSVHGLEVADDAMDTARAIAGVGVAECCQS